MSYDDDFYTDEPLASPQPSPNGEGDAKPDDARSLWDYVAPPQTSGGEGDSWGYASPPPSGGGWGEAPGDSCEEALPSDISMLLSMIRKDYWTITSRKSFYEQALFMAGYEDDAPILPFSTYFPTYQQMTVGQLRSYFTIRKLLRQGNHPDVPLSYLFVYVYETLMQIGVASPEEGYEILCDLRDNYPSLNPDRSPYLTDWLRDYVVWYGLSDHFAECFPKEQEKDLLCETLNNYTSVPDEELFNVLDEYSRHTITKAALYKKRKDAAIEGVVNVFRQVAPAIEKHFSGKIGTLCLGRHSLSSHVMFSAAEFYSPEPVKEATVEVSPLHKYVCHNGLWKHTIDAKYVAMPPSSMHALLHDIDAAIRRRIGVKPYIKLSTFNPGDYHSSVLPEAADAWFAEWRKGEDARKAKEKEEALRQARASVSIDLSKLSTIREDANVVIDKLIVDEEENADKESLAVPAAPISPINPTTPINSTSSPEKTFIKLLLEGGDYRSFLRSIHTPAGVMVEKINDKAMDVIGDIVLEDDGENITVIDDYREDIKHLYD